MGQTKTKSYHEAMQFASFDDRFAYLKLSGKVGIPTFGNERHLNQSFYRSQRWKHIRDEVIIRDDACDLAVPGLQLPRRLLVHHITPITIDDILDDDPLVTDLDNLICVSYDTHQAIHYGDPKLLPNHILVERKPNDMSPWKR